MTESPSQRRPVPWNGNDVVFIFLLWISLTIICVRLATFGLGDENTKYNVPRATTAHPLTQLIQRSTEQPIMLLAAFFSAVILAPVTEELLFRLVFQGWLQKRTAVVSTAFPKLGYPYLSGGVSIFVVSIVFAAMHGGQRTEQSLDVLYYGILGVATANLLTCFFVTLYLSRVCGAKMSDFGFRTDKIPMDFLLGLGVFALCAPGVLVVHKGLSQLFPTVAVDPVPLFLFSIALGILIYRTGRLLPCIIMHAALNGFSFLALVLQSSY